MQWWGKWKHKNGGILAKRHNLHVSQLNIKKWTKWKFGLLRLTELSVHSHETTSLPQVRISLVTYKIRVHVVKAQDMFDNHEGWQTELAESAQVRNLRGVSSRNAFDKMLQAYKTRIRAEKEGGKSQA